MRKMRHSEVSNLANIRLLECVNEQMRCCWFLIRAHLTIDMTVYQAYNFRACFPELPVFVPTLKTGL